MVEGLLANLISISQLCDQGFIVNFSKDKCEALDSKKSTIMTGTRPLDNCYHCDNDLKNLMSNLSKFDETILCHQRLRHISISKICKTLKAKAVQGYLC